MFDRFKKLFKKEESEMTQEETEETKDNVEEKDGHPAANPVDKNAGEQEQPEEKENSQDAQDGMTESEGAAGEESDEPKEQTPDESENFEEVIAAQSAKISSLESELAALKAKFDEFMTKDEGRDFGGQITVPEGNPAEDKRNAVFESYAGSKAKNYY